MSDPDPPPDTADIMTIVHEAAEGLGLEPAGERGVWHFTRRELLYLWSQQASYLVPGSYHDPYIHRLHAVQNELTRQLGAYPFIMEDLTELPTDRLNIFDIIFSLLATYSDYIIGVFERESGGETPELGKIDDPPYLERSYVYLRGYSWITDAHLEPKHHAIQAAFEIVFTDDLAGNGAASKIKLLLERAQDTGINIAEDEVWEVLSNRTDTGEDPVVYGWVHLNRFREFELHGRRFPWTTEEELRAAVTELPPPTPCPEWKERNES